MNEEIYEDLFKNVVINGHYSFEKLNEMKSYIKTLNIKIENLEHQVKKQKEVIDRILGETKETRNIINNNRDDNMLSKGCLLSYLEIVEDLLKEVSE